MNELWLSLLLPSMVNEIRAPNSRPQDNETRLPISMMQGCGAVAIGWRCLAAFNILWSRDAMLKHELFANLRRLTTSFYQLFLLPSPYSNLTLLLLSGL